MFMATVESSSDKSRRSGHDLLEQGQHVALQRFQFRTLRRNRFRDRLHRPRMKGVQLREFVQPYPLQAFGKDKQALVGHFDDFVNDGQSARPCKGRWAAGHRRALRAAPPPQWSCLRPAN